MQRDSNIVCFCSMKLKKIYRFFKYHLWSDEFYVKRNFYKSHGYKLDLNNPQTLCEKIQWLKLHDRRDFNTLCADKYLAPQYIGEKFGQDCIVPILFSTDNCKDICFENMPDIPFIIKSNHASGQYYIVKDKRDVKDWRKIQLMCRKWLDVNYYWFDKEWQYKNIQRRIIVEKLLLTSKGEIPNDYKLHCINGKVQFIYVAAQRQKLGCKHRLMYSPKWEPLMFAWDGKNVNVAELRGEEIEFPQSLSRMIEIAEGVAQNFRYVRVDFYDVDGKPYFGEITLHDGGGNDVIEPEEWDLKWSKMLKL